MPNPPGSETEYANAVGGVNVSTGLATIRLRVERVTEGDRARKGGRGGGRRLAASSLGGAAVGSADGDGVGGRRRRASADEWIGRVEAREEDAEHDGAKNGPDDRGDRDEGVRVGGNATSRHDPRLTMSEGDATGSAHLRPLGIRSAAVVAVDGLVGRHGGRRSSSIGSGWRRSLARRWPPAVRTPTAGWSAPQRADRLRV